MSAPDKARNQQPCQDIRIELTITKMLERGEMSTQDDDDNNTE